MPEVSHTCASLLLLVLVGCGQSAPSADAASDSSQSSETADRPSPHDLSEQPVLVAECPTIDDGAEEEIAAQASALVPLKPGLTLSTTWHRTTEADEVECLTQVQRVDAAAVAVTASRSMSDGVQSATRRTCRTDLRAAYMFSTGAGDEPDVIKGTTMFSLSTAAFGELKSKGSTRHRNVTMSEGAVIGDLDGLLQRLGTDTLATSVNDRIVDLPVVRVAGTLRGTAMGKPLETRVEGSIMDDERFPLVLDYTLKDVGARGFSVRYAKLSYPTDGELEERLASAKQVDVYGIYFDPASERLRPESEPVLREIADVLSRNPDWILSIDGHTDNTGGEAYNLDLSRRRSEAVRQALVERHLVAAQRLTTRGFGASQPKDTNETPEGRARNRRVELQRR